MELARPEHGQLDDERGHDPALLAGQLEQPAVHVLGGD